jgi:hypothetical protein
MPVRQLDERAAVAEFALQIVLDEDAARRFSLRRWGAARGVSICAFVLVKQVK